MPTSPNIANYRIGKGIVSFKLTGGVDRDLGNCPSFAYTPTVEKKDHFSSREGIKKKDKTVITQVGATIKFTMDEITGDNLAIFALANTESSSDGTVLRGLSNADISGTISVVGTNDVGQQVDFVADVSFNPSGDFQFITDGDDYSVIEVEAEVQKDANGDYGVWTIRDVSA